MHKQIFVNLPVKNLTRSVDFFTRLGYTFNPKFTDENATAMIVGENLFVMLLQEKYFASFITKPVSDAKKAAEVLVALPFDSREQVDQHVAKAVAAGARTYSDPKDLGFMYQHGFEDLDGHIWEIFWFDPKAA